MYTNPKCTTIFRKVIFLTDSKISRDIPRFGLDVCSNMTYLTYLSVQQFSENLFFDLSEVILTLTYLYISSDMSDIFRFDKIS